VNLYDDIVKATLLLFLADLSDRAVYGMKCLRPLEHWDRGFESHSRHDCPFWFRVRVNFRPAVYSQSVRLGDKPLETHDQYFFFT
jgi:hypothetical protein